MLRRLPILNHLLISGLNITKRVVPTIENPFLRNELSAKGTQHGPTTKTTINNDSRHQIDLTRRGHFV